MDKIKAAIVGAITPLQYGASPSRLARLFPKRFTFSASRLPKGLQVNIAPNDWSQTVIYEEIFIDDAYDLSIVGFKPDQIVDCGGHIGLFSLLASATFPTSKLTVFEPNPENYQLICEHFRQNGINAACQRVAVGAENRKAFLAIKNSHSAVLSSEAGVETDVIDLTEFISQLGPCGLLLKLDIEGEEKSLWSDLIPQLPQQTVVFFETHHGNDGWMCAENNFVDHGFEVTKQVDRGEFCDGVAVRRSDRNVTDRMSN